MGYYAEGDDAKGDKQIRAAARVGLQKLSWPGRIVANRYLTEDKNK